MDHPPGSQPRANGRPSYLADSDLDSDDENNSTGYYTTVIRPPSSPSSSGRSATRARGVPSRPSSSSSPDDAPAAGAASGGRSHTRTPSWGHNAAAAYSLHIRGRSGSSLSTVRDKGDGDDRVPQSTSQPSSVPESKPLLPTTPATRSSSSKHKSTRFLLLSLVFHLVWTYSVFSIYFTSPVVHTSRRFSIADTYDDPSSPFLRPASPAERGAVEPPADRLVLIVADGLRADTIFGDHDLSAFPDWAKGDGGVADFSRALWEDRERDRDPAPTSFKPSSSRLTAAPYLRSLIANGKAAWGVSHTRVPTESRPGHVALIAGMYEDVSAVTKGWKLNPINFDSVFNQSSTTFGFGSPDIVPMFERGAPEGKVKAWCYDEEDEDFTKDATHLDLWVLHHLRSLLKNATEAGPDSALYNQLYSPGTVIFLHLLGLDTTGHAYRPHSPEYLGNLVVVDAIVREVVGMLDDFFAEHDGVVSGGGSGRGGRSKTAYVFTADHGMSVRGNHGDGDPDNTRTPLIVWGSGVQPTPAHLAAPSAEERAAPAGSTGADMNEKRLDRKGEEAWSLGAARRDVEQADVAALMAALLSLSQPANSEGELAVEFLDASDEHKARASLANVLSILEQYRAKDELRAARLIRYVPYAPLVTPNSPIVPPGQREVDAVRQLIRDGRYEEAIRACKDLRTLILKGLRYLQTYDRLLLCSLIVAGYLGSILYSILFVLDSYVLPSLPGPSQAAVVKGPQAEGRWCIALGVGVLLNLFAVFAVQNDPPEYYAYAVFPVFFWTRVLQRRRSFARVWERAFPTSYAPQAPLSSFFSFLPSAKRYLPLISTCLASITAIEGMVLGYTRRSAWSVGWLALAVLWPLLGMPFDFVRDNRRTVLGWAAACVACACFTLEGVEKQERLRYIVAAAVLFTVAGLYIVSNEELFLAPPSLSEERLTEERLRQAARRRRERTLWATMGVLRWQILVTMISAWVTYTSARSLQRKAGLPLFNQIVGWIILASSLVYPISRIFVYPRPPPTQRLLLILYAFAPVFLLLSIADETLFYGSYAAALFAWATLEIRLFREFRKRAGAVGKGRWFTLDDVRRALMLLFLLHVGFFGTGNVASISSFYLEPVYRLIPVFNPFAMASLLILKILMPFFLLACLVHYLSTSLLLPPFALFLAASIAADVLGLNFLFLVTDQGSWLEIGQTITHFVMANLLQVFLMALSWVSKVVSS